MAALFDTHAHYDDSRFDGDRDAVLKRLPSEGIGLIVNPGCDEVSSRTAVSMAEKYPYIYAAVGIHPEHADGADPEALGRIRTLAENPRVKAIGEIGLDYYYDDGPDRQVQKAAFCSQLEIARDLGLPVIVHDRQAHGDCMELVRRFAGLRGVCHCYSGSLEDARTYVKLGWYLSFTGVITYKNAAKAPDIIRWMPMDRIMIETDSPYLAPVPHRGKRNDSSLVRFVAEKIAEIRGMDAEEVARITMENGKRFFEID